MFFCQAIIEASVTTYYDTQSEYRVGKKSRNIWKARCFRVGRGIEVVRVTNAGGANSNLVPWRDSLELNGHVAFVSAIETIILRQKFCPHYNIRSVNQVSTLQTIQNYVWKFERADSKLTQPLFGRPRTSREPENLDSVRESARRQPDLSTWK